MAEQQTHTQKIRADRKEFLTSNATYFTKAFIGLSEIFETSDAMSIICEEKKRTLVVGVSLSNDDGAMDVDCIMMKPNQKSLRDCFKTLAAEGNV